MREICREAERKLAGKRKKARIKYLRSAAADIQIQKSLEKFQS